MGALFFFCQVLLYSVLLYEPLYVFIFLNLSEILCVTSWYDRFQAVVNIKKIIRKQTVRIGKFEFTDAGKF